VRYRGKGVAGGGQRGAPSYQEEDRGLDVAGDGWWSAQSEKNAVNSKEGTAKLGMIGEATTRFDWGGRRGGRGASGGGVGSSRGRPRRRRHGGPAAVKLGDGGENVKKKGKESGGAGKGEGSV
jgi:hypothetical protein